MLGRQGGPSAIKGPAALEAAYLSSFPPVSSSRPVPFPLSDNKRLLLIADEPSLSLLSHAEEPLRRGHLLPEGVSKPPAGALQPDPGKPGSFLVSVHQFGGQVGGAMKNSEMLCFGDLKLLALPGVLPSGVAFWVTLSLYNG